MTMKTEGEWAVISNNIMKAGLLSILEDRIDTIGDKRIRFVCPAWMKAGNEDLGWNGLMIFWLSKEHIRQVIERITKNHDLDSYTIEMPNAECLDVCQIDNSDVFTGTNAWVFEGGDDPRNAFFTKDGTPWSLWRGLVVTIKSDINVYKDGTMEFNSYARDKDYGDCDYTSAVIPVVKFLSALSRCIDDVDDDMFLGMNVHWMGD